MQICVVGIGYVGLVTAGCLAEAGNNVVCVDNDSGKIARLKDGAIPIYESGLTEIVERNEKLGRLHFTTDLKYAYYLSCGRHSTSEGWLSRHIGNTFARRRRRREPHRLPHHCNEKHRAGRYT